MPLFMDYHLLPGLPSEEAQKAQLKDLPLQEKYNVKYHRFSSNKKYVMGFSLIIERKKNSAKTALDVGINNPSYFAKCFHNKYGILPSQVAV